MVVRRWVAATAVVVAALGVPPHGPASADEQPIGTIDIDLQANDMVFDPVSGRLFLSIGSDAPTHADRVVAVDPTDGSLIGELDVGADPDTLAVSDDGSYLYVSVVAEHSVRRVALASMTVDRTWVLEHRGLDDVRAREIEVMPGNPEVAAVVMGPDWYHAYGVVVLDSAGQRPAALLDDDIGQPYYLPALYIAFSADDPTVLYGIENRVLMQMHVAADGVHFDANRGQVPLGHHLSYVDGMLSTGPALVDPATASVVATAEVPWLIEQFLVDPTRDRLLALRNSAGGISGTLVLLEYEFNSGSNSPNDSFTIGAYRGTGAAPSIVAVGDDGFAISAGEVVYLVDPVAYRGSSGEYTAVTPSRVLDTRAGIGTDGAIGPVGPGGTRDVRVAGVGGVPTNGVDSVVLNATVAAPTESGYLTVWPTGGPQPDSSNLNFATGETRANLVTVPVGVDGKVSLFNERGGVHVIFDVVGFYATADGPVGSRFRPLSPARLFDTRGGAPVGPGGVLRFDVTGAGGVPEAAVTAVAMNVTAVNATANSYVTVWPDDAPQPNASNINFPAGGTVPNLVIMRVPPSGMIDFFNESGDVHLLADVVGYYTADRTGEAGRYVSAWPFRMFDTRVQSPFDPPGDLWPGDSLYFDGKDEPYAAYVLNVTVTGTQGAGYVTVHPWPGEPPNASNLNYTDGVSVPNAVIVRTGPGMAFSNFGGFTHLIADVFGAFTAA